MPSIPLLLAFAAALSVTDGERTALDRISADSLKEHLQYIASDELAGRATPSPGLEKAAAYIAASFRSAGLDPGGDDGYFQKGAAKNVVGILRGSDPELGKTCVVVSAHYDHVGVQKGKIYHGANDDGSGTVSVMEIASALATLTPHPKRSIVFVTFYGEEIGERGSKFFVRHPVCPQTIADINLEQVGRTDSNEGARLNSAALTGFEFTDIPEVLERAGRATGISFYKDGQYSTSFFSRSDNASFADIGIPSTTLAVAFVYPDYHQPGDTWEKIDYENMARVDRAVALALIRLANAGDPPRWNTANPEARHYAEISAKHARPSIAPK